MVRDPAGAWRAATSMRSVASLRDSLRLSADVFGADPDLLVAVSSGELDSSDKP
jgi:hypothetical protein